MYGEKVKKYLDENGIKYLSIKHSLAYTALEIADSAHISGKLIAKTVILKKSGKFIMAVIPAHMKVNTELLEKETGAPVEIASEEEFQKLFPDCESGAMPPFGNLYNLEVIVAEELTRDVEIAFNAGTHNELIRIRYSDFERLVKPSVGKFARL